jgi:hypothetical protein
LNMAIAGAMVLAESLRQINHDHSSPLRWRLTQLVCRFTK